MQAITFSPDSKWVVLSTFNGTARMSPAPTCSTPACAAHGQCWQWNRCVNCIADVFAISPHGGPVDITTHPAHVPNTFAHPDTTLSFYAEHQHIVCIDVGILLQIHLPLPAAEVYAC